MDNDGKLCEPGFEELGLAAGGSEASQQPAKSAIPKRSFYRLIGSTTYFLLF
jgi:hypothetical protein